MPDLIRHPEIIETTCMKLHSIRQDLQDYQDFFGLVKQYLVHLAYPAESGINPVKKGNSGANKFLSDQTDRISGSGGAGFRPAPRYGRYTSVSG